MKLTKLLLAPAGARFVLLAVVFASGQLQAQPGAAPAGTAAAHYYSATGDIVVSVANVSNWYIQSESLSLTGPRDGVDSLPLAPGSELVLDNALRIGEFVFGGNFTYTDVDLGAVAETNLPLGDLNIYWNAAGLSQPLVSQPVVYFENRPDDIVDQFPQTVDGRALLIWQRGETDPPLDPLMLAEWQANFGQTTAGAGAVKIPEPSTWLVVLGFGLSAIGCRR